MLAVWAYTSLVFLIIMTSLLLSSGNKTKDKKKVFVGMVFLFVSSFGVFCLLLNMVLGL